MTKAKRSIVCSMLLKYSDVVRVQVYSVKNIFIVRFLSDTFILRRQARIFYMISSPQGKRKISSCIFYCKKRPKVLKPRRKKPSVELRINSNSCKNHAVRRVYHPQLVAVYHQHEVLYIIKPQEDAR